MTNDLNLLLQLAQMHTRAGEFRQARTLCAEIVAKSRASQELTVWISAVRIHLQCSQELSDIRASRDLIEEVANLTLQTHSTSFLAQCHTLLASWNLAKNDEESSRKHTQAALNLATEAQDLSTLSRALLISATLYTLNPETYAKALMDLDKIHMILGEIHQPETMISAKIFKGFIYNQKLKREEALEVLWQAYEESQKQSLPMYAISCLGQLARIYRDQKQKEKFHTLSTMIEKSVSAENAPRIYKALSSLFVQASDTELAADFKIDQRSRFFQVKNKGVIDFKNQHILFDLALLLISSAGVRYSKESLTEKIWGQVYDPQNHDNLIYVSIKRLRTLIEPDAESPYYLLRDRKGYYINPQASIQFIQPEEISL